MGIVEMIKKAKGQEKESVIRILLMKQVRSITGKKVGLVEARNIVLAIQADFDLVPRF